MVKGQMSLAVSSLASPYWTAHTMQTAASMARLVVARLQMVTQVALQLLAGQTRPCRSQVRPPSALALPCPTPSRPTLFHLDARHPPHMLLCLVLPCPARPLPFLAPPTYCSVVRPATPTFCLGPNSTQPCPALPSALPCLLPPLSLDFAQARPYCGLLCPCSPAASISQIEGFKQCPLQLQQY